MGTFGDSQPFLNHRNIGKKHVVWIELDYTVGQWDSLCWCPRVSPSLVHKGQKSRFMIYIYIYGTITGFYGFVKQHKPTYRCRHLNLMISVGYFTMGVWLCPEPEHRRFSIYFNTFDIFEWNMYLKKKHRIEGCTILVS